MPSAAARRLYEDQIPSFMSIIGPERDGINDRDRDLVTVVEEPNMMDIDMDNSYAPEAPKRAPPPPPPPQSFFRHPGMHQPLHPNDSPHRHHDSASTQNSESADSSPTTTLVTDSSSISDPSPSSSPDSPVNLVPLNSYPATNFGGLPSTMNTLSVGDQSNYNGSTPYTHLERPMTSPSPRRRNLKGLSIQPPLGGNCNMASNMASEPSSPSFIKPKVPAMKRKPSGLSLKTDSMGLNLKPCKLEVPPSPGKPPMLQRRALKHSTSSPHMLSAIKSATFGPAGGMTLPGFHDRGSSGLSEVLRPNSKMGGVPQTRGYDTTILEEDSPIRTQVANRAAMDFEPFRDESENNEDLKSPSYPDGPVAIYHNVYLYLEPTAEEASKFDLVINVAREVTNPFTSTLYKEKKHEGAMKENLSPIESPTPDTAMTNDSFATAFEYPPREDRMAETPTTPKANPFHEPEYIHMLWDHNTDISVDLMSLCELIDSRVKEDKKVLVHCQQGASRSASLIIAYGCYQNPGQSVNDAYYAAQAKSKWISPNMRLMYCLQDFQKQIQKKKMPPRSAAGPRSGRSPTKHHRLTLSADAIDAKPTEPLTAPLPDSQNTSNNHGESNDSSAASRPKSTPNLEAISPGPSSAPSCFSWLDKEDEKDPGKFGRFNIDHSTDESKKYGQQLKPQTLQPPPLLAQRSSSALQPPPTPGFRPGGFGSASQGFGFDFGSLDAIGSAPVNEPIPERTAEREVTIQRAIPEDDALMSPRAESMTNNPLHDSFTELSGMKFVEQPPTPPEGLFSPRQTMFPRDALNPFVRPTQIADPRSPPTKGETPITRSIDDMI